MVRELRVYELYQAILIYLYSSISTSNLHFVLIILVIIMY